LGGGRRKERTRGEGRRRVERMRAKTRDYRIDRKKRREEKDGRRGGTYRRGASR